ncbi:MAG: GNAT family N-acetyltransferase [Actinomycetota bacterium]
MDPSEAAWRQVHSAAEAAGVSIVPLTELDDVGRISLVIERTWGGEADFPPGLVRAFQHAGCVLYGAESHDGFVGFVLGFLGWEEGQHVHSHMLAVIPEWRARGVGFALKLAQRAACLEHGIGEVRWTFDPLVARNARFNLVKLGAVATRLLPEFYGDMTDLLNRGDRSDRFEVRWVLKSKRVERAIRGEGVAPPFGPALLVAEGEPSAPRPRETSADPAAGVLVAIPREHLSLKAHDPALGREWRGVAAQVFQACYDRGLAATWFTDEGCYVFESRDDVL